MFKSLRKASLHLLALPLLFIALGTISNQLVLNANNDTFPVRINPYKLYVWTDNGSSVTVLDDGTVLMDETHCVMTKDTHLNLLADIIDFRSRIYSVGDGLLYFGEWLWTFMPYVWGFAVIRKLRETE